MVEGRDLALRAKELDPDNPVVYVPIAIYAQHHGDFAGAFSCLIAGEPERVIGLLTQAINLNPKHPNEFALVIMGVAYFWLGDNDAAIEWLQKALEANPGFGYTYAYLAMAYALKGEDAKARAAAADLRRVDPNRTLSAYRKESALRPAAFQEWFEGKVVPSWRKAGLPE
jgi:adenylate cyclase